MRQGETDVAAACAFTGHRPHRFAFGLDEDAPACRRLLAVLEETITGLHAQGITTFYSGLAMGVDLWAAETVLRLKARGDDVRLCGVVPFRAQAESWPAAYRRRYAAVLRACDARYLVGETYTPDCYLRRNRFLVQAAGTLLAVYDAAGASRSGTGQTVRLARAAGRTILFLHPETLLVTREKPGESGR